MELLPCPFCGGIAELDTKQFYRRQPGALMGERICVYCTTCNAGIGVCREDDPDIQPETVVDMWNNRHTDDLIVLLMRLVRLARKAAPDSDLPDLAMEYLKNNGVTITPHRSSI